MKYILALFLIFSLPVYAESSKFHQMPDPPSQVRDLPDPANTPCPDPPSKKESENYNCYDKEGVIRYPTEMRFIYALPNKGKDQHINKIVDKCPSKIPGFYSSDDPVCVTEGRFIPGFPEDIDQE